ALVLGTPTAINDAAPHRADLPGAGSTEFGPGRHPVVGLMTEWTRGNTVERRNSTDDLGGTMRLGAYPAMLAPGSRVAEIYRAEMISERPRHRYEVNVGYQKALEAAGPR